MLRNRLPPPKKPPLLQIPRACTRGLTPTPSGRPPELHSQGQRRGEHKPSYRKQRNISRMPRRCLVLQPMWPIRRCSGGNALPQIVAADRSQYHRASSLITWPLTSQRHPPAAKAPPNQGTHQGHEIKAPTKAPVHLCTLFAPRNFRGRAGSSASGAIGITQ